MVTCETGRLLGPGLRWQSRHQLMLRGVVWVTVTISSMRPWQVTQPIPAATCDLCVKYAYSGRLCTRIQRIGRPLWALSRIGASATLSRFTVVWQFMHVCVGGRLATLEISTEA